MFTELSGLNALIIQGPRIMILEISKTESGKQLQWAVQTP